MMLICSPRASQKTESSTTASPADSMEVVKATEALLNYNGPVYFRLCGEANDPMVYKEDYNFEIGKSIVLREGADVTIIAVGTMVYQSLQAAKKLAEQGVECTVINMHTIKPIDKETIEKYCHGCKLVVTVEEGFVSGGLGAAVLEEMAASRKPMTKVLNIGLTEFPHAGSYKWMLSETGLDAEHIVDKILVRLAE